MRRSHMPILLGGILALLASCRAGDIVHDVAIANVHCLRGDDIPDEPCAIAVDGNRITYVGPRAPAARRHIDGRGGPWIPALSERGRIEVGYVADVVVWDPATVQDHATSEQPLAPSTGVVAALVGGIVVIDERQPVSEMRDTGRWLRGRFAGEATSPLASARRA